MRNQIIPWSLLSVLCLSGCASTNARYELNGDALMPLPVESGVEVDAALPLHPGSEHHLFRAAVNTQVGGDLAGYSASYALAPGNILRTIHRGDVNPRAAPNVLGARALVQRLNLAVPLPQAPPVRLGFTSRERSQLALLGQQYQRQATARLQWAPGPLALDLGWSPPELNLEGPPMNCSLRSRLSMPIQPGAGLDLTHRRCRIFAPGRRIAGPELEGWGTAWRWDQGRHALRFERLSLAAAGGGPLPDGPDFELGWRHRRSLGSWHSQGDLALRRLGEVAGDESDSALRWAGDLLLRRELDAMALVARWTHAQDPLWFAASATPIARERFSLGLDFTPWVERVLPQQDARMVASWQRIENAGGATHSNLNWRVSLLW